MSPTIPAISRRLLLGGGLGAATLTLVGCQGSAEQAVAPAASASGNPADHVVTDYRGVKVGLDAPPTRVITTYDGLCVDNVVACGLTPISAGLNAQDPERPRPWLDGKLDGVEYVPTTDGLDFEKFATLAPDLIVSSYYDEETYEKLSAIAPLYMIKHDTGWRDQLEQVGRLLWREKEASAAAALVDQAVQDNKAKVTSRAGEQLAVISTFGGDSSKIYTSDRLDGIGIALEELGFAPLPEPKEPGNPFIQISAENADTITGDRLVVIDFDYEESGPSPTTTKLLASAIGAKIPARAGGVVWMSKAATNGSYLDTALSMPFLLSELAQKLA